MLGTKSDANGGIASVISLYHLNGLFNRQHIVYLATHSTGTSIQKVRLFTSACLRLSKLLLKQEVSIVHVHVACDTSFWRKTFFVLVARTWGVPTVLHIHAGHFPDFYRQRCNKLSQAIVRYVLEHVQQVAVVSTALNKWVRTVSRQRAVVTIYNPAIGLEKECGGLRQHSTLLFLGRLGKAKGTYDLLKAMPEIIKSVPDVKLLLCGDGDTEGAGHLIRQLSLTGHVEILGWVDPKRRAELLAEATLYVLPSYAEGLPMSVLEAMAAELPVVATRVGGVPEAITHELEGLLVEPGDVHGLASSIVRLLEHPDERKNMALAGKRKAQGVFGMEKTISSLEALYDEMRKGSGQLLTGNRPVYAPHDATRQDSDETC